MDSTYRIRLPFRDIDMHGHMHNAAYVSHFEAALSHSLRARGLDAGFKPNDSYVFLVRKIEVNYAVPCYYDDEIAVSSEIARIGTSSLTCELQMQVEAQTRAAAQIVWICVDKASGQSTAIPDGLRATLELRA